MSDLISEGSDDDWSGCLVSPAFEIEAEVLSTSASEASFLYILLFLSKRFHSLQHTDCFMYTIFGQDIVKHSCPEQNTVYTIIQKTC